MQLNYVKNKAIDRIHWDECIRTAQNGNGYAWSWYLDIVAGQWDALILDEYEAVMPLPFNRKLAGFKQVYQPIFAQQLGVFYSKKLAKSNVEKLFLEALKKETSYFNLAFNEGNKIPALTKISCTKKINLLLDLNQDVETITQNYSRSLKRRLKKNKAVHSLEENTLSATEVVALYRQELQEKVQLSDTIYKRIEQMINTAIERDLGSIYVAKYEENKIGAAGFFLESHHRIVNLFGTSSALGRTNYSMHFLLDAIIQKQANTAQIFDFEGSSIPSIAQFFKSFGAEEAPYQQLVYNNLPPLIRNLK